MFDQEGLKIMYKLRETLTYEVLYCHLNVIEDVFPEKNI